MKLNSEKLDNASNIVKFMKRKANKEYGTHLGMRRHINKKIGRSKLVMWISHGP